MRTAPTIDIAKVQFTLLPIILLICCADISFSSNDINFERSSIDVVNIVTILFYFYFPKKKKKKKHGKKGEEDEDEDGHGKAKEDSEEAATPKGSSSGGASASQDDIEEIRKKLTTSHPLTVSVKLLDVLGGSGGDLQMVFSHLTQLRVVAVKVRLVHAHWLSVQHPNLHPFVNI